MKEMEKTEPENPQRDCDVSWPLQAGRMIIQNQGTIIINVS